MTPLQFPFQRKQRIVSKSDFNSIFTSGKKRTVGPLLILTKSNSLNQTRLGLSVPKRVGNAVVRNKIKRRCREAFRTSQQDLPKGLDILVTARPHTPLQTDDYSRLIKQGVCND